MSKISILGCGAWGMALALSAQSCSHSVVMYSPFEDEVNLLKTTRQNEKLLSGITLPNDIYITNNLDDLSDSSITIIATPSFAVRETAKKISSVKNTGIIVSVAKGIEKATLLRFSEVIEQELPKTPIVILSGPSHAEEVARKVPTSLVAASKNLVAADTVQSALSSEFLRIYTNSDIVGVEFGGALKNVIAIAAGICEGLELGDNTRAALITRGLTEMARLGSAYGANDKTFAGLSGLGDLIVTCTSKHSRNNRFGNLLGKGISAKEALDTVGTVEGYYAAETAYKLATKAGVEMPIIEQCYNILYNDFDTRTSVKQLMLRENKNEIDGINF